MRYSALLLCSLGAAFVWPTVAHARCCSSDHDCPAGFICWLDQGATSGSCRSNYCLCDSDCAPGMRCLSPLVQVSISSDDGRSGKVFWAGQCLPPWRGPCGTDEDCGVGFQCSPPEGWLGVRLPNMCYQVTPSVECVVDTDCSPGWTCDNLAVACTPATVAVSLPSGQPGYPDQRLCYPPYRNLFDDSQNSYSARYTTCSGGDAGGTSGAATDAGTGAVKDAGESRADSGSGGGGADGAKDTALGGGSVEDASGGQAAKDSGTPDAPTADQPFPKKGGCAVDGGSRASRPGVLLAISVGLAGLRRVRRSRSGLRGKPDSL